jgi:hypothetical protein
MIAPGSPSVVGEGLGHGDRRVKPGGAGEGPGGVDGLDLGQGLVAVDQGHGAEVVDLGDV